MLAVRLHKVKPRSTSIRCFRNVWCLLNARIFTEIERIESYFQFDEYNRDFHSFRFSESSSRALSEQTTHSKAKINYFRHYFVSCSLQMQCLRTWFIDFYFIFFSSISRAYKCDGGRTFFSSWGTHFLFSNMRLGFIQHENHIFSPDILRENLRLWRLKKFFAFHMAFSFHKSMLLIISTASSPYHKFYRTRYSNIPHIRSRFKTKWRI